MSHFDWSEPPNADVWCCTQCGKHTSSPGATLCHECRNPGEVLPPSVLALCDECGQLAERRILTPAGILCPPCSEQYMEAKRRQVLGQAKREDAAWWERVLRRRQSEKELVK